MNEKDISTELKPRMLTILKTFTSRVMSVLAKARQSE